MRRTAGGDRVYELTFDADVSDERARGAVAALVAGSPVTRPWAVDRFPVGPLRVRCRPYRPVRLEMLAALGPTVLEGSADGAAGDLVTC